MTAHAALTDVICSIVENALGPDRAASIGVDVVDIDRFQSIIEERGESFMRLVFTEAETVYCNAKHHPATHFAGTFAAKEAVFKALHLTWNVAFSWWMIEIKRDANRCPHVELHGVPAETYPGHVYGPPAVSISYAGGFAVAAAIVSPSDRDFS